MINIEKVFDELFPINRSITGQGFRESIKILSRYVPFILKRYPSKKKVYDWIVPFEWEINDAYIQKLDKTKVIDFKKSNLHVLNYSTPISKVITKQELKKHLYTHPLIKDAIPYVTSYYKNRWGKRMSQNQLNQLNEKKYKVLIDSKKFLGEINWAETKLKSTCKKNENKKTILLSSYLCHPSMANNELSGPLILILLYLKIKRWKKRNYNYLFLLNPETIGSICFIHKNEKFLKDNLIAGLVLTCLGGKNKLSYKKSRNGNSIFDHLFNYYSNYSENIDIRNFDPTEGSDERQFCSGNLNLPVGQLSKTIYGSYDEYHSSKDNKEFVKLDKFHQTTREIEFFLKINDQNNTLKRNITQCELQMSKRGLYPDINTPDSTKKHSTQFSKKNIDIFRYLLSYSDDNSTIFTIANNSDYKLSELKSALKILKRKKILL